MPATGGVSGWLWGGLGLGAITLAVALVRRYGWRKRNPPK
jgi:hypothetical protein